MGLGIGLRVRETSNGNVFSDGVIFDTQLGIKLEDGDGSSFDGWSVCDSGLFSFDFDCVSATGVSGIGNSFGSVSVCGDNGWPVEGDDYDSC